MLGLVRHREEARQEVRGTVWDGAQRPSIPGVWHASANSLPGGRGRGYSGEVLEQVRVRRAVGLAAASLMSVTLLAACGGGDETPEETQTTLGEVISSEGAAVLMEAQSLSALDQPIAYPKGKQAQVSSEIEVLEPGQESGWRKYRVPVYIYVMEGTISVEYDAGVVKDFPAGSAFLQAKGIWHNISNKADSRAQMLNVVMGAKGVTSMAER